MMIQKPTVKQLTEAVERLRDVYYLGSPIVSKTIFAVQFADSSDALQMKAAMESIAKLVHRDKENVEVTGSVGPFSNDCGGGWRNIRSSKNLGG